MAEPTGLNLPEWIAQVQKASDATEVLAILARFRKESWSDDDRARMAKVYVKVLERVGPPTVDNSANSEESKDDGPVWYEKM